MEHQAKSAVFCNHANEMPAVCLCNYDCYCKEHSCKPAIPRQLRPVDEPNEFYENMIAQMRSWLASIYPASKIDRALKVEYINVVDSIVPKLYMRAKIWTFNNMYSITASIHQYHPPGHLGCDCQSRKPRSGETWSRGNDLSDGDFGEKTWQKILLDIVRYETEEVKSEKWKETTFTPRYLQSAMT